MFEPFLLVGSLLFWIFVSVLGVIVLTCVEKERGDIATVAVAVAGIAFIVWGDINLFTWIASHTLEFLAYLTGYFAVGTVWAVIKWYFYLMARKGEASDIKSTFCNRTGISPDGMTSSQRDNFISELINSSSTYKDRTFPPDAMYHKTTIMRWAAYWPFSAFWTVLGDGIRLIWTFIHTQLGGLLTKMSANAMKDI